MLAQFFWWQSRKRIIFDTTANLAANVQDKKSSPEPKRTPSNSCRPHVRIYIYICRYLYAYLYIYYIYKYMCIYQRIMQSFASRRGQQTALFSVESQRDFSCKQPPSAEAVHSH